MSHTYNLNLNNRLNSACIDGDVATVIVYLEETDVDLLAFYARPIRNASLYGHLEIVKPLLKDPQMGFENMDSPMVKQLEHD